MEPFAPTVWRSIPGWFYEKAILGTLTAEDWAAFEGFPFAEPETDNYDICCR